MIQRPDDHRQESLDATGAPENLFTLVETYFHEVYPCAGLSFVRRDVVRGAEDGTAPFGLLLSVCAMAAAQTGKTVAREWVQKAKAVSMQMVDEGHFTPDTLATLLLCFHYELRMGLFGAAWLTSGMTSR